MPPNYNGGMSLLLALQLLTVTSLHALSCDEKSLCEAVKNSGPVEDRVSNGRTLRGSHRSAEETKERQACFTKQCRFNELERMNSLFNDVQSRIGNVITKGRKIEQLSSNERAVVKAFATVKLLDPGKNMNCRSYCGTKGMARAMNEGVCICPWMELLTDEMLIYTMGHELAHFGDICAEETGLKPGQHPFEINASGGSVLDCLQTNGIAGRAVNENKTWMNRATRASAEFLGLNPDSLAGKALGPVLAPVTALSSPGVLSPHCRGPIGHSEMQEATADLVGYQVLADFLKSYPLKKGDATNVRRVFSYYLVDGCVGEERPALDHHSSSVDRVVKIAMSLPELREALGCSGHSANLSCDYRPTSGASAELQGQTKK